MVYSRLEYIIGQVKKSIWEHDYQIFLENLVKARHEAGLTQVQTAERLGQTQVYVSKSEKGERRLDIIEVARFAFLYNKPLSYFIEGAKFGDIKKKS